MKTAIFLLMAAISCYAQKKCCIEEFSSFANDESFVNAHPEPAAFTLTNGSGKMITFDTPDGKTANAYEVKAERSTNKYLFIFHEWYGLNDYIKQEADNYQRDLGTVNVLALDLYDGKLAGNNEEARKYVQSVETERATNIIKGAMNYAGMDAQIGTLGWCFGGGWSLQAGIILGYNAKAVVIYYGMPEKNKDKLVSLSAPVLGIFALKDEHITPAIVDTFKENMENLGKEVRIKSYDAVHAFANPSNPKHDKVAAEDARKLTIEFLKEKLGL